VRSEPPDGQPQLHRRCRPARRPRLWPTPGTDSRPTTPAAPPTTALGSGRTCRVPSRRRPWGSSSSPAGTSASKPGSSARGCHSCSRIPPRPVGSSGLTLHRSPQGRRVAVGTWTGHRRQTASVPDHYRAPGWFSRNVFNRAVAFLTRHGVSVAGSRVLAVKGRTSGAWRTTPVNLLEHGGRRYLVSPRGEGQWVRNLRVARRCFVAASCRIRRRSRCCVPT
jgi:hypothetical protein